ncbi:hypothetical protein [Roseovarius sp.]|uniref:hypothetical protein n=1 Tax=Roseovarius sp. TaxID=1486281 RepID=UPI003D0D3D1C
MVRNLLWAGVIAVPWPAAAAVTECSLAPADGTSLVSGVLRIYAHDGAVHSAFLETRTEYGDDLPYVFICDGACRMDMAGDDYVYALEVGPSLSGPERVSLVTRARADDFTALDRFAVRECVRLP